MYFHDSSCVRENSIEFLVPVVTWKNASKQGKKVACILWGYIQKQMWSATLGHFQNDDFSDLHRVAVKKEKTNLSIRLGLFDRKNTHTLTALWL